MDSVFAKLKLEKNGKNPLYMQIEHFIIYQIENNHFKVGEYLPPEEEIAAYFNISRATVRHAFQQLVSKSYVKRQKAKGTCVLPRKVDGQFFNKIMSFDDEMREKGITPSTKVINLKKIILSDNVKKEMESQVTEGIYLERVRYGDGFPMVITETYMPYIKCFPLLKCDLEKINLYHAMRDLLDECVIRASRSIQAVKANNHTAELLNCDEGDPIMYVITKGYNQKNEILEYSIASYHGERNIFNIELRG